MQRVFRAIGAGFVVVVAACVNACDGGAARVPPPPAVTAVTWREVGAWSGRLSQQTGTFEVSTVPMRLRWQTMNETSPGAGRLTVTLHSIASGRALQTIVDAHGVASATVDVADEPRWAYFMIEAADVDWQMTLEEPVASAPR